MLILVFKVIRFQPIVLKETLQDLAETDGYNDDVRCKDNALVVFHSGNFELFVVLILWYVMLHVMNLISKHLQSSDILIDVAIDEI